MSDSPPKVPSQLSAFGAVWLTLVCVMAGFACLTIAAWLWGAVTGQSFDQASAAASRRVEVTTLCQLVAMGAAIVVHLKAATEPGRARDALGLAPVAPARLALLFAAGLALQLPLAELANVLHAHVFGPQTLEEQRAMAEMLQPDSPWARLTVWLCLGLLVPAAEELLFRGALLTGLVPTQQAAGAVVVSAALFGLCHLQPVPVLYAFVAGLALGGVRLWARSTYASIAVHAGVNTLPIVLGEDLLPVTGFNVPSGEQAHLPPAWALGGLLVGGVLVVLALRGVADLDSPP